MNLFYRSSLQHKQMLVIMLTTGAALLLACLALAAIEVFSFRASMIRHQNSLAQVMGGNCAAAVDFNDPRAAEETLAALAAEPSVEAACLYSRDGSLFVTYTRTHGHKFNPPACAAPACDFSGGRLRLFNAITVKGERVGTIYLESNLDELHHRLAQYAGIMGCVLIFALLLALVLSHRLQRLVSGPILGLLETTRKVAAERNYALRASGGGADEIVALVAGFNDMLAQIQQRDSALSAAQETLEERVRERTAELELEVAERRRAEEALRESKTLYHSLVEYLPIAIHRKDREGRFVFANSRFCEIKGLTLEQLLGKTTLETGPAKAPREFLERVHSEHLEVVAHGRVLESEEEFPAPDGRLRCFQTIKVPVFGPDGAVIGTQAMLLDITERKQAELELARERELLRALMDNSPDPVYFKDRESRFVRVSKYLGRRFGLGPNEVIGKTDFDFFDHQHANEAFQDEQNIIRTGEPILDKVEHELLADGSGEAWVLTSKLPWRNRNNEIIGTFGITKDISAIKRTEAKLAETHQRLVEASRLAGMAEVATSVLHNVGNVLNSVNVSASVLTDRLKKSKLASLSRVAELLRDQAADLPGFFARDPKGQRLPGYLQELAIHLAGEQEGMLRELGSLARNIEHIKEIVAMQQSYARVAGVMEQLDIGELIEDALRMNAGALDRHQVHVVREFGAVPKVLVDKHKVLQILVNLIRNAKYALDEQAPARKELVLRTELLDEERVRVSVRDNGVGIPAENLTRIFEHGFTTRKEGHGFGLHSGALAAREMGAALTVESAGPGRGACFILDLPCKNPELAASPD